MAFSLVFHTENTVLNSLTEHQMQGKHVDSELFSEPCLSPLFINIALSLFTVLPSHQHIYIHLLF
jgi:hypothetical protein